MSNIMDNPIVTETHIRLSYILIRTAELTALIRAAACQKCGIPDSDAVRVEISFEDETAGSPAYKTGTRVAVKVIEDQTKLPQPD